MNACRLCLHLKTCKQDMYTEAHEKIREDPTGEPAEKKDRRMFAFDTPDTNRLNRLKTLVTL